MMYMKNEKDRKKKSFLKKLLKQAKKEIKENPITLILGIIATAIFSGRQLSLEQNNAQFDRLLQTPCLKEDISFRPNDVTVRIDNVGESIIVIEDIFIKNDGIEKSYKDLYYCVEEELPEKDQNGTIIPDESKLETYESEDENEPVSVYIDSSWIDSYVIDIIGDPLPSEDGINLLVFQPDDPENMDQEEITHQIRAMRHLLKDYEIEIKYRAIFQDEDDLSSLIITFDAYKNSFIQ